MTPRPVTTTRFFSALSAVVVIEMPCDSTDDLDDGAVKAETVEIPTTTTTRVANTFVIPAGSIAMGAENGAWLK